MITSSACCIRERTKFGRFGWELRWRIGPATPQRRVSRPSRCRGRRDRSRPDDPRLRAIADAARELNELRERWLNPPDAIPGELKKRTLTNLNGRPAWLANAHRALDRAVWAAYGWD